MVALCRKNLIRDGISKWTVVVLIIMVFPAASIGRGEESIDTKRIIIKNNILPLWKMQKETGCSLPIKTMKEVWHL